MIQSYIHKIPIKIGILLSCITFNWIAVFSIIIKVNKTKNASLLVRRFAIHCILIVYGKIPNSK
jgi:hypothetical protein